MTREGAAPWWVRSTLFGTGGVQGLDGAAHRTRKAMLLGLLMNGALARLVERMDAEWARAVRSWEGRRRVCVADAAAGVLARGVCDWAGVVVPERDLDERTRQLRLLFDAAGDLGLSHWRAVLARRRLERWLGEMVEAVRAGRVEADGATALSVIALHEDERGERLGPRVAAVELLNILRPTVAIAVYVTFLARALVRRPGLAARLRAGDEALAGSLVQETRRHSPFFPFAAAVTRRAFEWRGTRLEAGRRVLLDLYGINHDARRWRRPDRFEAERFIGREVGAFEMAPQGGGDHWTGHRCAGEWTTIALLRQALDVLATRMSFSAPSQNLKTEWRRLPALPRSGVMIENVRRR